METVPRKALIPAKKIDEVGLGPLRYQGDAVGAEVAVKVPVRVGLASGVLDHDTASPATPGKAASLFDVVLHAFPARVHQLVVKHILCDTTTKLLKPTTLSFQQFAICFSVTI